MSDSRIWVAIYSLCKRGGHNNISNLTLFNKEGALQRKKEPFVKDSIYILNCLHLLIIRQ